MRLSKREVVTGLEEEFLLPHIGFPLLLKDDNLHSAPKFRTRNYPILKAEYLILPSPKPFPLPFPLLLATE